MSGVAIFNPYQRQDAHFGMLPALVASAARAICAKVKEADPRMVRTHLLSVISSAVAPFYVVTPPEWRSIPIGVNSLCIACVGSGKSPIHDWLIEPLCSYTRDSGIRFDRAQVNANAALEEQKLEAHLLKAEIARCRRKGEPEDELKKALDNLNRCIQKPVKHRPRLANNLDRESMLHQLDGAYEAIDFITDEGEKFFESSLMRHVSGLVDLMDGKPMEYRREKEKRLYASHPRGTFGLMAQPVAVEPYRPQWKRNVLIEHKAVKLGFFARLLVCVAEQMPYGNQYASGEEGDASLATLHEVLASLYGRHEDALESGGLTPTELFLAPDAVGYWHELERITQSLRREEWAHLADFVSKMLNLTARVAAVLHVWESETHYISLSCIQRAWDLVWWHAGQYEQVFVPAPPIPQQEEDVAAIVDHLANNRYCIKISEVPTEPIGLLLGMPNNRLRAAILRMEQRGLIDICGSGMSFVNCTKMFSQSRCITRR